MNGLRKVRQFVIDKDLYHAMPLIAYMFLYLIWFRILEVVPRSHYYQVVFDYDRLIPFVEIFVIPYISWFFFIVFGTAVLYFTDRKSYDELQTMLMLGMTLFLLISTFLPNRQPLRLIEMPRNNIFTRMVAGLWKTDSPTNVWPSIHVYNSAAIAVAFFNSEAHKLRRPWFRIAIIVWSILIILSTVFIKQHTLFDMVTALSFMIMIYVSTYTFGFVYHCKLWDSLWKKQMSE